jgi:hypothetical protein
MVGRQLMLPAVLAVLLGGVCPAAALDLFTLWRQPMIPLQVVVGDWVEYHLATLKGGQRTEEALRVQCIGQTDATGGKAWLIEMLPLEETEGHLTPISGEGWLLQLSQRLLRREGELSAIVERVVQWEDGEARELTAAQWRDDPLVAASLRSEFSPQEVLAVNGSNRVVAGQPLACDQFQLAAADTESVELPRGRLEQISVWEITAAVNDQVPFFGVVFASERTQSHSRLDPPNDRFTLPPPLIKVETMELVAYGHDALPCLVER